MNGIMLADEGVTAVDTVTSALTGAMTTFSFLALLVAERSRNATANQCAHWCRREYRKSQSAVLLGNTSLLCFARFIVGVFRPPGPAFRFWGRKEITPLPWECIPIGSGV